MIKNIILFLLLFVLQNLYSQVTFVVEKLPNNTPKSTFIYISGDFEDRTGGQEKNRLKSIDHKYFITIPATPKTIYSKELFKT